MEVNFQLHALPDLSPSKEPKCPSHRRLGVYQDESGLGGGDRNIASAWNRMLVMPRNHSLYRLGYSSSFNVSHMDQIITLIF
jgi:hypothetical protein